MNAAGRLSLYGAGLVVAFAGSFALASAVVPGSVVTDWTHSTDTHDPGSGNH